VAAGAAAVPFFSLLAFFGTALVHPLGRFDFALVGALGLALRALFGEALNARFAAAFFRTAPTAFCLLLIKRQSSAQK